MILFIAIVIIYYRVIDIAIIMYYGVIYDSERRYVDDVPDV